MRFGEEPASYSSDGALVSGPSDAASSVRRRRGLRRTKPLHRRGKVSETTSHMLQRMSGVLEKVSKERAPREGVSSSEICPGLSTPPNPAFLLKLYCPATIPRHPGTHKTTVTCISCIFWRARMKVFDVG